MASKFEDSDSPAENEPSFLEKHGRRIVRRMNQTGKLFGHQLEALEALIKWFSTPATANQTAIVSMPTGSGKTGVISCLPYYFGKHVANDTLDGIDLNKPILVIAPGKEILRQLKDNLFARDDNTFLSKRGIIMPNEVQKYHYRVHVIKTADDIAPQTLDQSHICLVNAQKGHKKSKDDLYIWSDLSADSFSVVIVDEAHHLPSKTWGDIVSRFKHNAKVVFFTATPFRCDKKEISNDVGSTGLAYHMKRTDAVEKGIIRNTNPIDLELVADSHYVASESEKKVKDMLPKIKTRLEEKNRDQPLPDGKKHKAILCVSTIAICKAICAEWNDSVFYSPLKASYVNSEMPEHQQRSVISDLKEGKTTLIVIVQMLLEGFDHAPISIAAIGTKIVSPVKFAQFIGRAQRVYRSPNGEPEPRGYTADVISDGFFEQAENYEKFENEALIPILEPLD